MSLDTFINENAYKLISIGVSIVLLAIIYLFCRLRFPDGNNIIVIVVAFSIADFVTDILFLVQDSKKVPELYVPSIFFFAFPFTVNLCCTMALMYREVLLNPAFHQWFTNNATIASATTLLAATQIKTLRLLDSRVAGLTTFSAPFSEKANRWMLIFATIGLALEDIPQFIIQVIFVSRYGRFELIPFLALVWASINITFTCLSILYMCFGSYIRQTFTPRIIRPDTPNITDSSHLSKENYDYQFKKKSSITPQGIHHDRDTKEFNSSSGESSSGHGRLTPRESPKIVPTFNTCQCDFAFIHNDEHMEYHLPYEPKESHMRKW
ncbi:hypothetical protein K7432_004629 [Basidiobolus ranarum]|uniref:Integral membrane protein n=1 Tax=Basidiobolus ranarum TaxID=34480 RepID=A0ABR2WY05_9FUNG